jgi:cell division protein FtsB
MEAFTVIATNQPDGELMRALVELEEKYGRVLLRNVELDRENRRLKRTANAIEQQNKDLQDDAFRKSGREPVDIGGDF